MEKHDVLSRLHDVIDRKFDRKDRSKFVEPVLLKLKMTLWSLSEEFGDCEPELVSQLLKELVKEGRVVSNVDQEGVHGFDVYFIPSTELLNEEMVNTYHHIKKKLRK